MRIALFASSFHPHLGGVEEVVRQLAHAQQERDDHPSIVTNLWPKDLPAEETFEGLRVRRYPFRVPERNWRQLSGAVLLGPATLGKVCRDLKAERADLIHVHCVSSNAHYALPARRRLRLPLVVTLHAELTMDASRLFERSQFARNLMRRALADADLVTACSARTLADAENFAGSSFGARGQVIYNGTDLTGLNSNGTSPYPRPYLLAMGRLVPQKGFDLLLRAYDRARRQVHASGETQDLPDLLLAGDGPERPALEQLARELKLEGSIRLLGRVDRPTAQSLVAGASLFVLASRCDEGLPMVMMEAMGAGRAVLAPSVGGIPEMIEHARTGWLFPREDVAALAGGLAALCRDAALCASLGAAARQRLERHTWPLVAEAYASAYEEAVDRARRRCTTETADRSSPAA